MTELATMNDFLSDQDDQLTSRFGAPEFPVCFIFSQPRAASTLFVQLAISVIKIGYADNLLARFWQAPYLGALIAEEIRDPAFVSNFKSRFGNTQGAQEPHEWGWFWRHWLKLGEDEYYCQELADIDGNGLMRKLAALESVMEAPLLFDNIFATNNFEILAAMPCKTLVVYLRRDPYFICNSMINVRLERNGDIESFYGSRPRNIDQILMLTDPIERIVAQVRAVEDEIAERLAKIAPENIFRVDYPSLVATPWDIIDRFAEFLDRHGAKVAMRDTLPRVRFDNRDTPALIRAEYKTRLDRFYRDYFGEMAAAARSCSR